MPASSRRRGFPDTEKPKKPLIMRKLFESLLPLLAVSAFVACSDDDVDGAAALTAPGDVACVDRTDTSLRFSWSEVDGAAGYQYKLQTAEGFALSVTTVETALCDLSDLEPETTYVFSVRAVDASRFSPYAEPVTVTTLPSGYADMIQLETPVPELTASGMNSLTFAWGGIEHAASYKYTLARSSDAELLVSAETEETTVTLGEGLGLVPGASYVFSVAAAAPADDPKYYDSEFSRPLAAKTAEDPNAVVKFPAWEGDAALAFPGAEGAGMYATGGRGGKVYHVTTLEDDESNNGSIRWIVQKCKEPRIVVFDVAGTIRLKSNLKINTGDITILGQTAPGDGICLSDGMFSISASNVIVQYMRFRPGDKQLELGTYTADDMDGIDAIGSRAWKDIIIDHCSMSWSQDECASFYVMKNFTLQWSMLYESLRNGSHGKGSHGYGGIWGGAPASFHHNLVAHHDSRNMRLEGPERYGDSADPDPNAKANGINTADRVMDFRNNVIYNFCDRMCYGGVGVTMNFVGNYFKWGPASVNGAGPTTTGSVSKGKKRTQFFVADTYYDGNGLASKLNTCVYGNPGIFLGGNSNVLDTSVDDAAVGAAVSADNQKGFTWGTTSGTYLPAGFEPQWTWATKDYEIASGGRQCHTTTHSADKAFAAIVEYCGASYRKDAADARVMNDVKNGLGTSGENASGNKSWYGIIDSPDDKGGYPELTATEEDMRLHADTDGDGIPDRYEDLLGLDKNNPDDALAYTVDPLGRYTNIECYAYYLVQHIVLAQVEGGAYTALN